MFEQFISDPPSQGLEVRRLWDWVRRHPAAVVFGALVLAMMFGPASRRNVLLGTDRDQDEPPMFI